MTIEEALAAAQQMSPDVSVTHYEDIGQHHFNRGSVTHTYFIHEWDGNKVITSAYGPTWEECLANFFPIKQSLLPRPAQWGKEAPNA